MPQLLDPTSTVAIILGAYDWTKSGLPSAPSFRRSAHDFHRYLVTQAPYGLGLQPDLIINLFNDPSPAGAQLARIRDEIRSFVREGKEGNRPIRDVLIYYLGHGSCEGGGPLHFLVRDTSEGIEEQSSITASDLAQVLRVAAPQQRRLVVLDCCFSEAAVQAFGAMGSLDEAVATTALRDLEPGGPPPERGTLLLCSSPRTHASIGIPNADRTLFTGALLNVLREGSVSPRRREMLSFSELRDDVYDRMLRDYDKPPPRPALHQPDQQAGDFTQLPAFPNAAWAQRQAEGEHQTAEAQPQAEEERQTAEALRKAEEERQIAEALRKAEEERQTVEAQRTAEEERRQWEQVPTPQRLAIRLLGRWPAVVALVIAAAVLLVLTLGWLFWPPTGAPVATTEKPAAGNIALTRPDVPAAKPLTVAGNSAATPIGIPAPSDPNYPADRLSITVIKAPSYGKVVLADRNTAVAVGQTLTTAELTGLMFVPAPGAFDYRETFAYVVKNPPGLTASGSVTLTIRPNEMSPREVVPQATPMVLNKQADTASGRDDYVEAARLYRLAADQGYAPAQTNLGFYYEQGRGGLAKDEREAARLYKLAADQGNTFARVKLNRITQMK